MNENINDLLKELPENLKPIVPEYLDQENLDQEDPEQENLDQEDLDQEDPEQENQDLQELDLSTIESLLTDIKNNQEVLISQVNYADHLNGLLQNSFFVVYFAFAFFIFGALAMVIKFFKSILM